MVQPGSTVLWVLQAPLVRQDCVRLIELVHRTGSLAPWLYLPPVVALATDASTAVSEGALGILKYCASRAVRSCATFLPYSLPRVSFLSY
jgi:hypothetical protein